MVLQRRKDDIGLGAMGTFNWQQVRNALKDYKTWRTSSSSGVVIQFALLFGSHVADIMQLYNPVFPSSWSYG